MRWNMTKDTFTALFGKQRPSVRLFNELLKPFPREKQEAYYRYACFLFVNEYYNMTTWYRVFLKNLMKHDLQRLYDYLEITSGFHSLRCRIEKREALFQLFHMLMASMKNVKCSFEQISFFILLGFDINLKISTLGKYIRDCHFTPETFFELAEYVGIYL
ncbi:MAG: hypothetical protein LBH58_09770 [Tannerellaceae bacterium]|jgi:hypothetical protein|nr:hypothetical protein [Tannerellaceae bacterium]